MIATYVLNRRTGFYNLQSARRSRTRANFPTDDGRRVFIDKHLRLIKPRMHNLITTHGLAAVNWMHLDRSEQRYLLEANEDSSIALHDLEAHRSPSTSSSCEGSVEPLAVICSGGYPGLRLRQSSQSERRGPFKTDQAAHSMAVSRVQWWPIDNGIFTSSSHDGTLNVWDTNELSVVADFSISGLIHGHECNPTGSGTIAIATDSSGVVLFDMRTGSSFQKLANRNKAKTGWDAVQDVRWSPLNDKHVVSCSAESGLLLYDVRKGAQITSLISWQDTTTNGCTQMKKRPAQTPTNTNGVAVQKYMPISCIFTADGQYVVCLCANNAVLQFDASSGRLVSKAYTKGTKWSPFVYQMATTQRFPSDLVFVPNGSNSVFTYNTRTFQVEKLAEAHFKAVSTCEVDEATLSLLSSGEDKRIVSWSSFPRERLVDASEDLSDWDLAVE